MAGKKSQFVSAPRLIIKMGSGANMPVIAYAIGINLDISVDVRPVFTLGLFAPASYEPTMMNTVRGSMQILRLQSEAGGRATTSRSAQASAASSASNFAGAAPTADAATANMYVNGDGKLMSEAAKANDNNSILRQSNSFRHLDPLTILLSETFDIDLYMNVDHTAKNVVAFMTIKDCRLNSRSMNMTMGQLLSEPVSFEGLLAYSPTTAMALDTFTQDTVLA